MHESDDRNELERSEAEAQPETAERPVPDVKHEPEPDAENIIPVQHKPGTL